MSLILQDLHALPALLRLLRPVGSGTQVILPAHTLHPTAELATQQHQRHDGLDPVLDVLLVRYHLQRSRAALPPAPVLLAFVDVPPYAFHLYVPPSSSRPVRTLTHVSPPDLIEGLCANAMSGLKITCTDSQFNFLTPPSGQNCLDYLAPYSASAAGYAQVVGDKCGYCAVRRFFSPCEESRLTRCFHSTRVATSSSSASA